MVSVIILLWAFGFWANIIFAGTLSCSVTTSCPSGTVIFKMSSTTNAHAGLTASSSYAQLVCCTGVTGLGTSCTTGVTTTVLKLSGTSGINAHAQQNGQTPAYANTVCLSVPSGGNVSVGYQASNCTSYDATLTSMSAVTNAHVGDGTAYTTKICATASGAAASVTCTTPLTSTSFGSMKDDVVYTSSPNATTTVDCSGCGSGFTMKVYDAGNGTNPGLYKSTVPTDTIGSANDSYANEATLSLGVEGYGLQATTTSASINIAPRFLKTGNNVGGLEVGSGNAVIVASSTGAVTNQIITHIFKAAVAVTNKAGDYQDTVTIDCLVNP